MTTVVLYHKNGEIVEADLSYKEVRQIYWTGQFEGKPLKAIELKREPGNERPPNRIEFS